MRAPLVILLLSSSPLFAAEPDPAQIDGLVARLGEPSFAGREEAARKLVEIGRAALPALEAASQADDLEIRYRARRVLQAVEEKEHEYRLQTFLDAKGKVDDDALPGWGRYRRDVGEDDAARKLFVEMQRAERRLFTDLRTKAPDFPQRFAKRAAEVQARYTYGGRRRVEVARLAAMLFLAGEPSLELDATTEMRVYSFCSYNDFRSSITSGGRVQLCRKVAGCWIGKADDADVNILYQRTRLAMQYSIKRGIVPARRMLDEVRNRQGDSRAQYALMALGRFGGDEELAIVESMFNQKAVVSRSTIKNKMVYTCELRDVALAVALHMTKQNTGGYGFARLRKNSTYLYSLGSAGFDDPKKREAAFDKYAAWRVVNPRPGEAAKKPAADEKTEDADKTQPKAG